ncbi:MAG: hypothetical protein LC808_36240, partial [Actinobacteria bacterium]|nr:hypothetical protein [Actinomycetota bacterium]
LGEWEWYRATLADIPDDVVTDMGSIVLPPICLMESYTGNLDAAHVFIERFERVVENSSFMQDEMALAGCRCTLALVEGRFEDALTAAASIRNAEMNRETEYDLFISPFGAGGRAALWARDAGAARDILVIEADTHIQNAWHDCRVATLEAGIAALEGSGEAISVYAEVLRGWDALQIPLGRALCQTDFALLVGGSDASDAREEALAFWRRAGNESLIHRLESAPGL